MINLHPDMLQLAQTVGYIGITAIIFAETGLFFGFFFPGDSLLFTAGLLAAQHVFNIFILLPLLLLAAILGYVLAYWIGLKFGIWLSTCKDNLFYKKRYLTEAKEFYEHHGGKALILGRLLPIIRTFVPIVAGMTVLSQRSYTYYNIIGALIWVGGMLMLGFTIGQAFPNAYHYIYPLVFLVIVISLLPTLWHLFKAYRLKRMKSA
jgi:membrane-associated protein